MKTTIGKNHAGFGAGCLVAALAAGGSGVFIVRYAIKPAATFFFTR